MQAGVRYVCVCVCVLLGGGLLLLEYFVNKWGWEMGLN